VLAAKKMDIQWNDWSGETAMRQVKIPILLIGGGNDNISRPDDIKRLKDLAVSGSKSIEIPEANHIVIGVWFHELNEPIKMWFRDHLITNPSTIVQKN
jgi:alpha-beta hydrolase superfamily lysophospholipase